MSAIQDFLTYVLPAEGLRIVCAKPSQGAMRQLIARDNEEAEQIIIQQLSQQFDVYFACSTYQTVQGVFDGKKNKWVVRTAGNVCKIGTFWLDLDIGPKGYATIGDLWAALNTFCQVLALPLPFLVSSGGGVHAYWRLSSPVDYLQWLPVAELLKKRCKQLGFQADPTRTADSASILRPPGTKNFKYNPPTDVVCGDRAPPVDFETFKRALENYDGRSTSGRSGNGRAESSTSDLNGVRRQSNAGSQTNNRSVASAIGAIYGPQQYSLDLISKYCRQIARFATAPSEPDEPDCYALAAIGRHCEDAAPIFKWIADARLAASRRYGTTPEWFIERGEKWEASTNGPPLCSQWELNNPGGCAGCVLKGRISTPLQSGSQSNIKRFQAMGEAGGSRHGGPHSNGGAQTEGTANGHAWKFYKVNGSAIELPPLPEPYVFDETGAVALLEEDKNGQLYYTTISQYPLYLASVNKSEIGNHSTLTFQHYLPHHGWRPVSIDQGELLSPQGTMKLANQGVNIHRMDLFRGCAQKMIDNFRYEKSDMTQFEQFGWKKEGFLFGRNIYSSSGIVPAHCTVELLERIDKGIGIADGANIDEWRDATRNMYGLDAIGHVIVMLSGMATPLFSMFDIQEGGWWTHGFNPATGIGKSLAAKAGCSVWGQWDAMRLQKVDSDLSQIHTLATFGNLPVFFDEIQHADPPRLLQLVETFTNGHDKRRMNRDGTKIIQVKAQWKTGLTSTDNRSMIDLLQAAETNNAMIARVLEIGMKRIEMNVQEGHRREAALFRNAGIVGDHLLRRLANPAIYAAVKKHLHEYADALFKLFPGGANRYRVYGAACIVTMAKMTEDWGILPFTAQRVADALVNIIRDNAAHIVPEDNPIELLSRYFSDNMKSTLVVNDKWVKGILHRVEHHPREGVKIHYNRADGRIFFNMRDFHTYIAKRGASVTETIDILCAQRIVLSSNKFVTLSRGTTYPGSDQRCYEIDATKIMDLTAMIMKRVEDLNALGRRFPVAEQA